MIAWRQQYADPIEDEALGLDCAVSCDPLEDRTLQQYKDEVDINTVMRRFGVTGVVNAVDRRPLFGDFTGAVDYQTALNMIREADREFLRLPSELRKQLDHDPTKLEAWVANPENKDLAVKLGLVDRPKPVEPIPVRVLADADPVT